MRHRNLHDPKGPSQRQLRVAELIRRTLSELLLRGDVHDPDLNQRSITVSEVRATPDLKLATVYVLPLGGHEMAQTLAALNRNKSELRRHLAKQTALKFAPDLRFVIDESFDNMDKTRRLLNQEDVKRDLE